jgi:3-deoxy-D-manno-octulosonic-acid transferase
MKFLEFTILTLYRFVWMPLALTITFLFLWPFNKKIQAGLKLRRSTTFKTQFSEAPILIHASSGEFEYAKPVISLIKQKWPNVPVVVSYFSPSYAKAIQNYPGVDLAVPLPLDLPGPIAGFIKKINPRCLLVARTDLWPELLVLTRQQKIPSLLFSTTFREMKGLRFLFLPYYTWIFSLFKNIFLVSGQDEKNIQALHLSSTPTILGDTRYDQVMKRLQTPKPFRHELFANVSTPILVAGSTWPEDETALTDGLGDVLKAGDLRLLLVPHEPTDSHLQKIEKQLTQLHISFERYSKAEHFNANVLIVDQVGVLAELYLVGHIAFVGGSFKSKVHSVMEPLAAGLITFVGPHHKNNREAVEFQQIQLSHSLDQHQITAVTCVATPQVLKTKINQLLAEKSQMFEAKNKIQNEITRRTGASEKVVQWLESYMI